MQSRDKEAEKCIKTHQIIRFPERYDEFRRLNDTFMMYKHISYDG